MWRSKKEAGEFGPWVQGCAGLGPTGQRSLSWGVGVGVGGSYPVCVSAVSALLMGGTMTKEIICARLGC